MSAGSPGENGALIRLAGLQFSYRPERPVLRGLHLTLHEGERIGLTGANGAGKSTLLQLIVGLMPPADGIIEVLGTPCYTEADFVAVRRVAGYLFQDSDDQLFCPTVGEDVAFGPLNLGHSAAAATKIALHALEQVGLAGFEDRITHELSGGEKRLAALAGVLAMKPRVLLLDEPLTGLDANAVERIAGVLDALPQAMLIVSHDATFLDRLGARTIPIDSLQQAAGE